MSMLPQRMTIAVREVYSPVDPQKKLLKFEAWVEDVDGRGELETAYTSAPEHHLDEVEKIAAVASTIVRSLLLCPRHPREEK